MTPSANRILKHLKALASITQREAILEYSTGQLSREISRLREAGYNINTLTKYNPVTGQRYARYRYLGESSAS